MDKTTQRNFIEIDQCQDKLIDSKMSMELKKRINDHYNIIQSDDYAKILKDF